MNIADNLELIRSNKDAIRNAITRKGVLTGSNMSTYADNIMQIGRGVYPSLPDLSTIAIQDDVMYFTVSPQTYWGMSIGLDTGTYTVESGTIVDGAYVANSTDSSDAYKNGTSYYCINTTDNYLVYRLTCTSHINALSVKLDATKGTQGLVEMYGAMPYVAIMNFASCAALQTCTIKSRLQLITSLSYCFSGCSSLTGIDTSSWTLVNCTTLQNCFQNCFALTSIDTSSWTLGNCTTMMNCFQNCYSLKSIDTSSWTLGNCTNMQYCFSGCSSLTGIDTSSWTLVNCISLYGCFQNCFALTSIDTSSWTLGNCTSLYGCFLGCFSLTSIDTSSWRLDNCTSFFNCFYNCSALTSIDTSSWTLDNCTSMQGCFWGCVALTSLNATSWLLSATVTANQTFANLNSLTSLMNLNCQNITNMSSFSCPKLINFRFLNYGARGDYKTNITLGSQVVKADIIQFFGDLYDRATAGYSVLTIAITQAASKYTAAEVAVATAKGYTITFNG